jgi:hypothetical protein
LHSVNANNLLQKSKLTRLGREYAVAQAGVYKKVKIKHNKVAGTASREEVRMNELTIRLLLHL